MNKNIVHTLATEREGSKPLPEITITKETFIQMCNKRMNSI
jgi:hypothetical protein